MEKTNVRYLKEGDLPQLCDFASVDVSFISLKLVLKPVWALLKEHAPVAALVKPQFEAGREKVGKKGVVRDKAVHAEVIEKVEGFASDAGFLVRGLDFSPITGPEGNIEYLLWLEKTDSEKEQAAPERETILRVVEEAHLAHGKP